MAQQERDDNEKGMLGKLKDTVRKHSFVQDPNHPSGPMQSGYETHTAKTPGSKQSGYEGHSDRTSPFAAKSEFTSQDPKWLADASKSDLERQDEKLRDKTSEYYDSAKQKATSARDTIKDKAADAVDKIKQHASVANEKGQEVYQRHVG
ncbi:hypothetical protein H257_06202 [Aphanomyces astaci]|uniref:Uncharacterized protein n=1 Tax=Aphanomyces astaci TaxID=112090 RepID=W4GMX0_APHAT|nr:hypothetical protein H257_06202 [Aphanomyces astaci]ETV80701.1 hypothetical protein H257_06202 [Aphanomyces astaci]|eukprot:XP_009829648.1 hypothetical protein H257_06202 [Aphanomyces astaci]